MLLPPNIKIYINESLEDIRPAVSEQPSFNFGLSRETSKLAPACVLNAGKLPGGKGDFNPVIYFYFNRHKKWSPYLLDDSRPLRRRAEASCCPEASLSSALTLSAPPSRDRNASSNTIASALVDGTAVRRVVYVGL